MDIRYHRHLEFVLILQECQSFFETRPTVRRERGAVGLVKGGLEDIGKAETGADLLHRACHPAGQFL